MTFVVSWPPAIPDSECLVSPFVVVAAVGNDNDSKGTLGMKIRLGVDIACRSPHHAACADETGTLLCSGGLALAFQSCSLIGGGGLEAGHCISRIDLPRRQQLIVNKISRPHSP